MDGIQTRGTFFPEVDESGRRARVQVTLRGHGLPLIADWTPKGSAVVAVVNHGRWIAHCDCGGAEFVDSGWPLMVCCSCGAGPYSVAFPKQHQTIEAELLKRPELATRNWVPGETVADLRAENRREGVTP